MKDLFWTSMCKLFNRDGSSAAKIKRRPSWLSFFKSLAKIPGEVKKGVVAKTRSLRIFQKYVRLGINHPTKFCKSQKRSNINQLNLYGSNP